MTQICLNYREMRSSGIEPMFALPVIVRLHDPNPNTPAIPFTGWPGRQSIVKPRQIFGKNQHIENGAEEFALFIGELTETHKRPLLFQIGGSVIWEINISIHNCFRSKYFKG